MKTKHILIAALLAGAFAPAMARSAAPMQLAAVDMADADDTGGPSTPGVRHTQERIVMIGADGGPVQSLDQGLFLGERGKPVKNAPYSAEVITEQQQNLADGNQIASKASSMSYRDSAGRTRQETRDSGGTLRAATIKDPTDGTTYMLNVTSKTAIKVGPRREMVRPEGEKGHKEDGEQVIVKRVERPIDSEARQRIREDLRVRISKMAEGRELAGIAGAFGDMKWASKASVKDLGTKEIDGIKAQGKLKSYEIPAGEIGNRNPIVVASETWFSPDLQVTLRSKRSDPRTGERTWRMANIKREEPAAALFAVPSDYAIREVKTDMPKFEKK